MRGKKKIWEGLQHLPNRKTEDFKKGGYFMTEKGKYWAFIVWEESVKENWITLLRSSGVKMVISPKHDMDVYLDDLYDDTNKNIIHLKGESQKPHWHVLVQMENTTTFNFVKNNVSDLVGGMYPILVASVTGYYKYLWHSDNPEKVLYSQDDLIELNGFFLPIDNETKEKYCTQIYRYIRENHVYEFCDLCEGLLGYDVNLYDYFISRNALFDRYITSLRNKGFHKNLKK